MTININRLPKETGQHGAPEAHQGYYHPPTDLYSSHKIQVRHRPRKKQCATHRKNFLATPQTFLYEKADIFVKIPMTDTPYSQP